MKLNPKTVLVLAPHTDDGEFGCGGAVARFAEQGSRVISVAFSAAEQSVPDHLPRDILRTEVVEATRCLGIADEDSLCLDFEVRRFPEFRQQLLDRMIELNREYKPDLVFMPSSADTHQDHETIRKEGFRAFKRTCILGYEAPWNCLDFKTQGFVHLTEQQLEKKIAAVDCFQSQAHRTYANRDYLLGIATMRGTQIGTRYAECFEVIRWTTEL